MLTSPAHSSKSSKRSVVFISILLMLVFSAVLGLQIHQNRALKMSMDYHNNHLSWNFMQLETESLRFRESLQVAIARPKAIDHDELTLRFNLFVSRINIVMESEGSDSLIDHDSAITVLGALRQFVVATDRYLAEGAVEKPNAAALRDILEGMNRLREPIHDLTAVAMDKLWSREEARTSDTHRQIAIGTSLIVFQCALTLFFSMIVIRQIRRQEISEAKLLDMATHDTLTGLPNRTLLSDRLQQALVHAARNHGRVGLLFIDLDHFSVVNDTLGHDAGDMLLGQVVERLRGCVRAGDTVARQGGDEFIVLLPEIAQNLDAGAVAQKILDALAPPFDLQGQVAHIGASIGIAVYPEDGEDSVALCKHSDAAMYEAKKTDRNNFQFFRPDLDAASLNLQALGCDLRGALQNAQLRLHYQPVIELESGAIIGIEALVRWQHPLRGMLEAEEFIALAEEIGAIDTIGLWVLQQVCAQARTWLDAGYAVPRLTVNLSTRQCRSHKLVTQVADILGENRLDARYLGIDIAERMIADEGGHAVAVVSALRAMGIRIAIDDFGIGYSNLGHLKRYPIDTLKIDRSFIHDLAADNDAIAIVRAMIAMAHGMRLQVVAEGVESAEQLQVLRMNDCDAYQGYHAGLPVPAFEMARLLRPASRNTEHEPIPS